MSRLRVAKLVMKVMGHTDARTAMQYQHPALDPIREAIDQRNLLAIHVTLTCECSEYQRK